MKKILLGTISALSILSSTVVVSCRQGKRVEEYKEYDPVQFDVPPSFAPYSFYNPELYDKLKQKQYELEWTISNDEPEKYDGFIVISPKNSHINFFIEKDLLSEEFGINNYINIFKWIIERFNFTPILYERPLEIVINQTGSGYSQDRFFDIGVRGVERTSDGKYIDFEFKHSIFNELLS